MHSTAYQTAVQTEYRRWATSPEAKALAIAKCQELRDTIGPEAYALWWTELPEPADYQDLFFQARKRLEQVQPDPPEASQTRDDETAGRFAEW